ncbi:MAG: NTP transferase domain-containing protein [Lachnospiraceae bacterium]|nr:NTP transferase domain-containing protein [Lachnospiraceae bacterium]
MATQEGTNNRTSMNNQANESPSLNINEFKLLNYLYNNTGLVDKLTSHVLNNKDLITDLENRGLVSNYRLTEKGLATLQPYAVDNAVIMAAGAATRFIPLSLEQPKGLYEVKGQRLIERKIEQLKEAGINDITIILGYKKEQFYYLKDKYGVKFVINDEYNSKNNIWSLYLAREELHNTYICCCDDYFTDNPFHKYEYASFYAGYETTEKQNEMYATTDDQGRILDMVKGADGGEMLLGHSFWTDEFSKKFVNIVEQDQEGEQKYNNLFWEWLVKDHLKELPDFYYKEYPINTIFEFDYFEQLRAFDDEYVGHAHSEILRNIKLVFRCDEEDIVDFRTVSEGMTNTSFVFRIDGVDYIYRHPGDGTEKIINRRNEKKSLITAKKIGVDPTYIYMDVNEGWKISKFIPSFREPDYKSFEDSKLIVPVLQKLHKAEIHVDYGMKPWDDACAMEKLIKDKDPHCFDQYEGLKEKVGRLYKATIGDRVEKCFCHGDTYKPNWMIEPDGHVILIDWEYSGYSDPGIDVGYYIVDAMYDFDDAEKFIKLYLGDSYNKTREFHFTAYISIIAYYWFVWAMYRESCGANVDEALENWRFMAEKYADYLTGDGSLFKE